MKRHVLIFGIAAGATIFTYSLIYFSLLGDFSRLTPKQFQTAELLGYARFLILLIGVVGAMVLYRKKTAGPITYRKALMVGVLVSAITSLFVGAMEGIYLAFINPDFYDQFAKLMLDGMRERGASQAEFDEFAAQQASFAWVKNPLATGVFYFFTTMVVGSIMALIGAAFARRKEMEEETGEMSVQSV